MITDSAATGQRDARRAALALLLSAILNAAAWMGAIALFGIHLPARMQQPHVRELILTSSSLRVEHRTVPRPPQPQARRGRPNVRMATLPKHRRMQQRSRSLAREPAHRLPKPARVGTPSLAEQLARQERTFAREARALDARRAVSLATIPPRPDSAEQHTLFNSAGHVAQTSVEAILEPLAGKHWIAHGLSCYYVHYDAEYSGGGTEEGNIPWPVCYPAQHDAMLPLDRPHALPIPSPPLGYVLPPGAAIGPLLRAIYSGAVHG